MVVAAAVVLDDNGLVLDVIQVDPENLPDIPGLQLLGENQNVMPGWVLEEGKFVPPGVANPDSIPGPGDMNPLGSVPDTTKREEPPPKPDIPTATAPAPPRSDVPPTPPPAAKPVVPPPPPKKDEGPRK